MKIITDSLNNLVSKAIDNLHPGLTKDAKDKIC
jgi:hypothetical protein